MKKQIKEIYAIFGKDPIKKNELNDKLQSTIRTCLCWFYIKYKNLDPHEFYEYLGYSATNIVKQNFAKIEQKILDNDENILLVLNKIYEYYGMESGFEVFDFENELIKLCEKFKVNLKAVKDCDKPNRFENKLRNAIFYFWHKELKFDKATILLHLKYENTYRTQAIIDTVRKQVKKFSKNMHDIFEKLYEHYGIEYDVSKFEANGYKKNFERTFETPQNVKLFDEVDHNRLNHIHYARIERGEHKFRIENILKENYFRNSI